MQARKASYKLVAARKCSTYVVDDVIMYCDSPIVNSNTTKHRAAVASADIQTLHHTSRLQTWIFCAPLFSMNDLNVQLSVVSKLK